MAVILLFWFSLFFISFSSQNTLTFVVPPENQTVERDRAAQFVCKASGQPHPTLTWKLHDEIIANNSMYTIVSIEEAQVLRIEPALINMSGNSYECVAKHNNDVTTASATLTVLERKNLPDGFPIFNEHAKLHLFDWGQALRLPCGTTSVPRANIRWYKDFVPVVLDDRIQLNRENGGLLVMKTFERDEGKYMCSATNIHGTAYSYLVSIYIRSPPLYKQELDGIITDEKSSSSRITKRETRSHQEFRYIQTQANTLTFVVPPENQTVERDRAAQFVCKASGQPLPTLMWRLNNKIIANNSKYTIVSFEGGQVLRIESASMKMSGYRYECVAENNKDLITANATLTVLESENLPDGFPIFDDHPKLLAADRDKTANLSCRTTAVPMATIRWYKDFVPVVFDDRIRLKQDTGHLIITRVIERDESKYMCSATNIHGTAYSFPANIYVRSRKVPPSFIERPKNVMVNPGESANLSCVGTGSPSPSIMWKRGNDEAIDGTNTSNGKNVLEVRDVWKSENFTCMLQSELGNVEHTVTVFLRELPSPPTHLRASEIRANSLRLSWVASASPMVESYTILFKERNSPGENYHSIEKISDTSSVLVDLQPYTYYEFRVLAVSKVGPGLASASYEVQTGEKIKKDTQTVYKKKIIKNPVIRTIENITFIRERHFSSPSPIKRPSFTSFIQTETIPEKHVVPPAPQRVRVVANNTSGVVKWDFPEGCNCEIRGFLLHLRAEFLSPLTTKETNSFDVHNTTTYTLNNLLPNTWYSVSVAGYSSRGDGPAREKRFKTLPSPEGAPVNFSITSISTDTVRLQWEPPPRSNRNGKINLWELKFYPRNKYKHSVSRNTSDLYVELSQLKAHTDYIFQVRAYTTVGPGPWSSRLPFRTYAAGRRPKEKGPDNIEIRRLSETSLEVAWRASTSPSVVGYYVYYSNIAHSDMALWDNIELGDTTIATIDGLERLTVYAVRVQTRLSNDQTSEFSEISYTNKFEEEEYWDRVTNLKADFLNSTCIRIRWNAPLKERVVGYKLQYEGKKKYFDMENIEYSLVDRDKQKNIPKEQTQVVVGNLAPKTQYVFNVSAQFADGVWGTVTRLRRETLEAAPSTLEAPLVVRTDGEVLLHLYSASEENGPISKYDLVVVPEEVSRIENNPEKLLLHSPEDRVAECYITASFDSLLPGEFILGDGSRAGTGEYLNRHLIPGQAYRLFIRAYTYDGKTTSSAYSKIVSLPRSDRLNYLNDASMKLLWVVAPVCAAIVLLLLLILVFIFLRRNSGGGRGKEVMVQKVMVTNNTFSIDPVTIQRQTFQTPGMMKHPPIGVSEWEGHVEALRQGDKFSVEYESVEPGQQFTWAHSNNDNNKAKNRYANVIAYDHSRIALAPLEGAEDSDYINANYMHGYRKHNAYIATQGPLPETFSDFWRMVWEVKATTIVMMTKLEERNRVKCDQYWPLRGAETYGLMVVSLQDVLELASYTIRTFTLSRNGGDEKREVRQFQFTGWPDHGVPEQPSPLLIFMRRVKSSIPVTSGPPVVHCSAGVGRTGAYIVIDSMLERIKHEKSLDVYGHVTCLRSQRNYMVQTEDQYVFIHDALLEAISSGNTEVPARNLLQHIHKLNSIEPGDDETGMQLEFKKLSNIRINANKFTSASLPVNKNKNRLVNILPYESTRVSLAPIRGVEGSDYINASFVDGYKYKKAYVLTQGPLAETTEDLWRMLWQYNSTIVVILTKLRETGRDKCHQYWPSERSARYQYFVVDPMAEYNMPQYILREFKVTDARDGQSRTIRQFHFTEWPETGVPKSAECFIDFIGQVHKTKTQFGQDGPITVHCSSGVGRSGVFVTLSILLERMRYEGVVDMFQTVKMLWMQRPVVIQSVEQYTFCYRAAFEYLGSFDHYAN